MDIPVSISIYFNGLKVLPVMFEGHQNVLGIALFEECVKSVLLLTRQQ
jgi:hypothetical protein